LTIGIYKITNTINNKVYIGESMNIEERWDTHKEDLNSGIHHSYKLQNDYNEYKLDKFIFEIIEEINYDEKSFVHKLILLALEDRYIKQYDSIDNGYNIENTLENILNGKKSIFHNKPLDKKSMKLLLNIIDNIESNNGTYVKYNYINNINDIKYLMPNNIVQNININDIIKDSYIQLYGKRTVSYFKQLIELQNLKEHIHFTIDMVLNMMNINNNNIKKERKYLKEFLMNIYNHSLLTIINKDNLDNISSSEHIIGKLNIYNYKEKENGEKIKINYFTLLESEYNKIMEYSGELDTYNLLNLFCNIKSRINNNDSIDYEIAYPSYKVIMNDIFIDSAKTLKKYINTLVSLDLIRFDYAGDMIMVIDDDKPIRKKSNFIYVLFKPYWKKELKEAVNMFKKQQKLMGWKFISKEKEDLADEKRSVTQKINMLEKLSKDKVLTQSQKKELKKLNILKRKQNT